MFKKGGFMRILLVSCFLVFLISCQHAVSNIPGIVALPKWISPSEQQCVLDSDCVLTKADCCGCNQGGKQLGVNKEHINQIRAKSASACAETLCVQVISKDASCKAREAKCEAGVCVPAL